MLSIICAECRYAECHYTECRYSDCRYGDCRYAECRGAKFTTCRDLDITAISHISISQLLIY
jgi:hypothetical protein